MIKINSQVRNYELVPKLRIAPHNLNSEYSIDFRIMTIILKLSLFENKIGFGMNSISG